MNYFKMRDSVEMFVAAICDIADALQRIANAVEAEYGQDMDYLDPLDDEE